ncbi:MAG: CHAT domain-containing protein [Symploca sp. SIO2D2]|nr:CHAT domain-containing protein [Symploca sp. SIO2D2]
MSKQQIRPHPQLLKFLCYFGFGLSLTLLKLYLDWTPAAALVPKTNNLILTENKAEGRGQKAEGKMDVFLSFLANTPIGNSYPTIKTNNAFNLFEQGNTLYQTGQFTAALEAWQQAATAYANQGELLNQAMTLSNLALAHQELGQWDEANQTIEQSLRLIETIPANTQEHLQAQAQALNTQGTLQLAQGQSETALTTWKEATKLYTQIPDEPGIIRSQINQALALRALGLYRRASNTLEQLEETTLKTQPDDALKAAAYSNLGNLLRSVSRLDQAQKALQTSLKIARTLNSPEDISAALLGLGNTARSQGDKEQAIQYYQEAATQGTSPNAQFKAYVNQLDLLLETKRLEEVTATVTQLQALVKQLPTTRPAIYDQIHFAQTLLAHYQAQRGINAGTRGRGDAGTKRWGDKEMGGQGDGEMGRWGDGEIGTFSSFFVKASSSKSEIISLKEIAQLLAHAQQQAQRLEDTVAESYALGYLGQVYQQAKQWQTAENLTRQALVQAHNAPEIAYRWQWQLGQLLNKRGQQQEAIIAYSGAYNSLKFLRKDLVAANPDIKFTFRDEVEPIYRELVDLLLQPQGSAEPGQKNLKQARQGSTEPSQKNLEQARQVMEALQVAELENFFQSACLDSTIQVDRVIEQKDSTAAVLYPILLEDRLEVILKLPGNETLIHYPSTKLSRSKVESTLKSFRSNLQDSVSFFAKEEGKIIYDWLIKPAQSDLERYNIQTLIFVLDGPLRNIPMAALYDGKQYLVENYATTLLLGLNVRDPIPLSRASMNVLATSLTEPPSGIGDFAVLANANPELDKIGSIGVPTTFIRDQYFTKTALEEELERSSFDIVHLATHGQFGDNPEETYILAADGKIPLDEFSKLFRSQDSATDRGIELLILSACRTATGNNRAVLGIAGTAIQAGARSAIASLWSLDDESSIAFTEQFYQNLGQPEVSRAEALQQAQKAMLQDPQFQSPLFWAPYVLVGSWL